MVWFFERGPESLRVETRYDSATGEYLLIVPRPDGAEQIERFKMTIAFRTRLDARSRTAGE